jgi:hypothetical protein
MREAKIIESFEAAFGQISELLSGQAGRLALSFVHYF